MQEAEDKVDNARIDVIPEQAIGLTLNGVEQLSQGRIGMASDT